MNPKQKNGLLSENVFVRRCLLEGWAVLSPLSPISTYDFVVEKDSKLYKVQVKTAFFAKGSKIVDTRRPSSKARSYTSGDYDYLFVVDLDNDNEWMIPWEYVSKFKSQFKPYLKEFQKWKV